jgi:hypothetical protein
LKSTVETIVREKILKAIPGLKESDMMVKLSAGSVLATVTVATPSSTNTADFAKKIHAVVGTNGFPANLGNAIASIEGIGDVTTSTLKVSIPTVAQDGPVTLAPTLSPTYGPKHKPTPKPTRLPTRSPTPSPTQLPTRSPTPRPTATPTAEPTPEPTKSPTLKPTDEPTVAPTDAPTPLPTCGPADKVVHVVQINGSKHHWEMPAPGAKPTVLTEAPTASPTKSPTVKPTDEPTAAPTAEPTKLPTEQPTASPSAGPTTPPTEETTVEATQLENTDPNEEPCAKTSDCSGTVCPADLCPDGKSRRQVGDDCCSCGTNA